jgi:oligopeptide transport system ATP-binding protein
VDVKYAGDCIAVMDLGKLVELASAEELRRPPLRSYTRALLSALLEPIRCRCRRGVELKGEPPLPWNSTRWNAAE